MAGQTYPGMPGLEQFVIDVIGAGPANGLPIRGLDAAIRREYGRSMRDYELEAMADRLVREDKICQTLGGGNLYPITHTALWCGHGVSQTTDVPDQTAPGASEHTREHA